MLNEKPKWHIDPEAPTKAQDVAPEPTEQAMLERPRDGSSCAWKRVQWTTYIRPEVLQALKEFAGDRSNEAHRRVTPADLLDEALVAYLKKHWASK